MRRRIANVCIVISAALCVVFIVLWIVSQWRGFGVIVSDGSGFYMRLQTYRHGIELSTTYAAYLNKSFTVTYADTWRWDELDGELAELWDEEIANNLRGFGVHVFIDDSSTAYAIVPNWAIAAVLLVPSVWWFVQRYRRRRRYGEPHCNRCGYDLRASVGACPECGAAIPPVGK